ncbi:phospholipase A1 member A isoform X3 [Ahaetulla prasina]|uniref:phospholipase A1 member A isoform X3 n=1 Tax=Ahaetulla prasina TaxID=499056 RepID=UPI0026478312|nr:phospholipase A1 member A isoform X3 [Ahaetulla prasina]
MNMNLRRWLALVLMVPLLFIFTESKNIMKNQECADFQSAHLLWGTNLQVRFLLFPFSNPSCGRLLSQQEDIQEVGFNASLGTKIIIHGFRALGTKPSWIDALIQAFLEVAKVNVIAVDWVQGATAAYPTAVENVMKLGLEISSFIRKLLATGVPESSIHLIGVSLGAHVGGLVGQFYEGHLGRITALDPAGPKYTRASPEERLDPGDALFVEAIHTDSDSYKYLICDHLRAVHFYISVLKDSCLVMAFPCSSYKNFLAGHCLDCFNPFLLSCPTIGLLDNGGLNMKTLPREVKVYLATAASAPYCVHHTLVEFHLQQRRTSDTNIEIIFLTSNSSASTSFIIPKQQMLGKGLLIHSAPLCQIESVMLQQRHKFWKRNKDEPPIVGHFCTAPLPVDKNEKMMCLPQALTITSNNPLLQNLSIQCD